MPDSKVYKDWHNSFINHFKGFSVRIDPNLEGGEYYISISQAVFDEINPDTVLRLHNEKQA